MRRSGATPPLDRSKAVVWTLDYKLGNLICGFIGASYCRNPYDASISMVLSYILTRARACNIEIFIALVGFFVSHQFLLV